MSLIIKTKIFDHDRVDYKVVTRTLRPFCQQRGMKTKNAELFLVWLTSFQILPLNVQKGLSAAALWLILIMFSANCSGGAWG